MEAKTLTPYDTGERLQPFAWKDLEDPEDYGNADFDNENGETVLTIHVSRNPEGGYTVHVIPQNDIDPISIETHEEN